MSALHRVVWSEGTFLQPQHFQQHDRYIEAYIEGRTRAVAAHAWGYTELALDEAALELGKVALRSARGILPDGTPFDCPAGDPAPEPLDVPAGTRDALVLLALPVRRPGMAETDLLPGDSRSLARYAAAEIEVRDSNASFDGAALLQVGRLRLQLMLDSERSDAYACFGVARVVERRPDNKLVLDRAYVPPVLDIAADATLSGFARHVHGLLHQRADLVAARVAQPGRGGVSEIAEFLYLMLMNRCEPVFAHLCAAALVHPERLYAHLVQLAGELSTFARDTRRSSAYPPYRHDDLAGTFAPVVEDLHRFFGWAPEQRAVAIELTDRGRNVRVAAIQDLDLVRTCSFVLAVNAQMASDALLARFPAQAKLGPTDRLRDLVNLHLPGIALRAMPVAPRQIPYHAGFSYFELDRGGELWKQLERSGGLAMHIAGDFPGLELELWAIKP
jgi:type VI secretion system protein ImpJ